MTHSLKLALSSILITLIVLGLSSPIRAQTTPPPPTIYVDAPSEVFVFSEFDIIISVHDIPDGWGMVRFDFDVNWNPDDLEFIGCKFLGDGRLGTWSGACGGNVISGGGGGTAGGSPYTEDAEWFRFRFHCLRAGPTPITVGYSHGRDAIELESLTGGGLAFVQVETVTVTVNQDASVGGVATPVSKIKILAPYLTLAGLIATVSIVYVIKRRKD
ncbi:hypothetical protein ACFLQ6_09245 [Thermoproteota archaeon]